MKPVVDSAMSFGGEILLFQQANNYAGWVESKPGHYDSACPQAKKTPRKRG
jgi:hypothetical protein